MTSKDTTGGTVPLHALSEYSRRTALHQRIREGQLPDTDDLLAGSPFFANDMKRDILVWCDSWLLGQQAAEWQRVLDEVEPGHDLRALIQNLRNVGSIDAMRALGSVMERIVHQDALRMLAYQACSRDEKARVQLAAQAERTRWSSGQYDRLWGTATVIGLIYQSRSSMEGYCKVGLDYITDDAELLAGYRLAAKREAASAEDLAADTYAESDEIDTCDHEDAHPAPTLVVVPKLAENGSSHRKDISKAWKDIGGNPLPLIIRGDVAEHRRALLANWPHAAEIIDIILGDLAPREEVRFRPTLLVGKPGSGKSSLARAICEQVGLPVQLYSVPSAADGSLGGTSAQWSTAREAVPLQLIKAAGVASVAIVWDEIEKASESRHNGNPLDNLLPMLEVDQARRYRDLALEVECDLSMVSHFATANSVESIPAPLKDRMRVLKMPEPGWQHLGTLTRQIINRVAEERGLDTRWYPPLAEDEMELVRQAWPGGSIRQLTRIVTTILDGREQLIGRC